MHLETKCTQTTRMFFSSFNPVIRVPFFSKMNILNVLVVPTLLAAQKIPINLQLNWFIFLAASSTQFLTWPKWCEMSLEEPKILGQVGFVLQLKIQGGATVRTDRKCATALMCFHSVIKNQSALVLLFPVCVPYVCAVAPLWNYLVSKPVSNGAWHVQGR